MGIAISHRQGIVAIKLKGPETIPLGVSAMERGSVA